MVISTTLSIPLHLLSMPVIWLLSPLTVLLQICGRVLSLAVNSPVALISRFKTLYIYCGTAAIIGAVAGSLVALLSYWLASGLGLLTPPSSSSAPPPNPSSSEDPLSTPEPPTQNLRLRRPSVPTILEEDEDSDEDGSSSSRARQARRRLFDRQRRRGWQDGSRDAEEEESSF